MKADGFETAEIDLDGKDTSKLVKLAAVKGAKPVIKSGGGKAVLLLIKRHNNTVFVPLEPEG